jgi:hypothetical protein
MSLTFEPVGWARAAEALRHKDSQAGNPSGKEDQMIKGLMLLMLAALLFQACADTNSSYRSRNPYIDVANTCATCGGSVQDNYFAGSNFRAIGPGNY